MPKVIIPKSISIDQYAKGRAAMLSGLPDNALFRDGYADAFLPFVCVHTERDIEKMKRIQAVIRMAVIKIVSNYFADVNIQKLLPLAKEIKDELRLLSNHPYDIGLIRPDFLFSKKGEIKVCEINARFTFNAFFMTAYMNDLYTKLHPEFSGLAQFEIFKNKADDIFDGDVQGDKHGDTNNGNGENKVAVIKGKEPGYDIHSLLLEHKHIRLYSLKNIKKVLKNHSVVVLELHQDELAPYLKDLCSAIKRGVRVINDPRTIYIVHDKRILSVLSNKDIMKKYLSSTEVAILQKHIIQTFSGSASSGFAVGSASARASASGVSRTAFQKASKQKDLWLIKKAISGKSDGLYTGKLKTEKEWKVILKSKDIILQPYIEQKKFACWNPYTEAWNDFYLAGTLPQWDEQSYGPGLYRMFDTLKEKFCFFMQPMVEIKK